MEKDRGRLKNLRNGLLTLHTSLLRSEQQDYELTVERVNSPGHWLHLLIEDPRFAWLRELSALIVRIDEVLDAKEPLESGEADALVKETRLLLRPVDGGRGFGGRYYEAMQRDPDAILAHAEMNKVLAQLD
jgi:hypothetical protein